MKNLSNTLAIKNTQEVKEFNRAYLFDRFIKFADVSNNIIVFVHMLKALGNFLIIYLIYILHNLHAII